MTAANPSSVMQDLSFEEATIMVSQLERMTKVERGGVVVYSGNHPERGSVHVIVPSAGDSLLIPPFVIDQF